ncbi:hypothetical protein AVEN_92948-1 [Araneus ventricosus]|uniref:Uncharacterized protein n=1 Tax=Araneus ventricosus TaxID=182803 RepID=A0A4Y2Q8R1_ARAVE|nr:hypothetical protein AVEN_92948-1 [Araneus ventricosus]
MGATTVSHAFGLSLIEREECSFAVTCSSYGKLSSTTFLLWKTMQLHKLFGGQLLAVLFHKIMTFVIRLQPHDLGRDAISSTTGLALSSSLVMRNVAH